MKTKVVKTNVYVLLGALLVSTTMATPSFAGWHRDHERESRWERHYDDDNRWERKRGYHIERSRPGVELNLFGGAVSLLVGSTTYYYSRGHYYHKHGREYVSVAAPVGAVIVDLPAGYTRVYLNGQEYYTYGGVYYNRCSRGYRVVELPRTVVVEKPVYVPTYVTTDVPVYIPNRWGGYSTVILKKSDNGYTGPRGEFYPEFPAIEQLRAMYGY